MRIRGAIIGLLAVLACEPLPYGETVVYVDTDLPVPMVVNHLRVDLYKRDAWFESREFVLANAEDWSSRTSFAISGENGDADVLVRLRAYSDEAVRDYHGEQYAPIPSFREIFVAKDVDDLCANAPKLAIGSAVQVRRGRYHISPSFKGGSCTDPMLDHRTSNAVGTAGVYVDIAKKGSYCFGPLWTTGGDPTISQFQQVTMQLRRDCLDDNSWITCEDGITSINPVAYGLPRISTALDPGRYFLAMSGGVPDFGPTDIIVGAAEGDCANLPKLQIAPEVRSSGTPIYLRNDPDITPKQEPEPVATVDRLLRVHVTRDVRRELRVTLHGDCAGVMAKLGDNGIDPATATTCIDALHPAAKPDQGEIPGLKVPFASPIECKGPHADDAVCVPGGAFLFGSRSADDPPRIAAVRSFFMDRHEVTVARLRDAFASGLALERDEDLVKRVANDPKSYCFYSDKPGAFENYAATCLSYYGARAFCNFVGGDLPTEAQWEYAATVAGSAFKRRYPWGDDPPRCDCTGVDPPCHAAVFGRKDLNANATPICPGTGPLPVDAVESSDVTPLLGIVGLGGGVAERVLDSAQPLTSNCWRAAGVRDPKCWEETAPIRTTRGGTFSAVMTGMLSAYRYGAFVGTDAPLVGFRCVYEVR